MSEAAREMANTMALVERSIHAMGGDVQTEGVAVVAFFARAIASLPLFRLFLWAPSARRRSRRLMSYGSKTVEESEAGRDVLEEFRDVVLDGSAVVRGCQQVLTVFGDMDTPYGVGVVA